MDERIDQILPGTMLTGQHQGAQGQAALAIAIQSYASHKILLDNGWTSVFVYHSVTHRVVWSVPR